MKPKFRLFFLALIIASFLALIGCATHGDLETLQRDTTNMTKELLALQRNLYDLNAEIKNLSTKVDTLGKRTDDKVDALGKRTDDLRQQMSALGAETRAKMAFFEKEFEKFGKEFKKEVEAVSQPMRRYQAELGAQVERLQMDVQKLTGQFEESKYNAQKTLAENRAKIEFFEKEFGKFEKEFKKELEKEVETVSQPMRRYQADLWAQVERLQMDVQKLTGQFEESKYFAQKTFADTKTFRESYQGKLDEIDRRIAALNRTLEDWGKKVEDGGKKVENLGNTVGDWGKKLEALEREAKAAKMGGETEEEKPAAPPAPTPPLAKVEPSVAPPLAKVEPSVALPPSKKAEKPEIKPVPAPEEAYKKAYDLFQKGDVEGAKGEFKRFLEVSPKSKYAENAHYWLGECYFAEKKFDEAILEFDEVIKKYPKGNKVPDALLRQGMAFLELNDTLNAKLILKEVIKRFPKSEQAKRASKKLKEIG